MKSYVCEYTPWSKSSLSSYSRRSSPYSSVGDFLESDAHVLRSFASMPAASVYAPLATLYRWLFLRLRISSVHFFFSKSLACMFLVIVGSFTSSPSSSLFILTWHPSLLVSVRPKARSSMSFSSSSGSSILLYMSSEETMTWHVEQAHDPPQAPSISRSLACAMSSRLLPSATSNVCDCPSLSMNVTCSLELCISQCSIVLLGW
jgi:hypothetical protein